MASAEEIFTTVRGCLVDALGVDEEEVKPEATLAGDLGAESIDYLDVIFRIEKAFGIKIDRAALFPDDIFQNPAYLKDGKMTPEGMAILKERMPFADLARFDNGGQMTNPRDLFTVQMIVNYVATKVA